MYPIEEKLQYGQYVIPKLTRQTPVYNWYVFPHSFSRELVHELLDDFGVDENSVVFDPFVGAGTTLLACREKRIPAFGIDQLPFSVFVSNVKTGNYNPRNLQKTLNEFAPGAGSTLQVFGSIPIIDKAFPDEIKKRVASIYRWIHNLPSNKQADFFLLALLTILERISRAVKSGGWLRIVENEINPDSVEALFKSQAQKMIEDLHQLTLPFNQDCWYAHLDDARHKNRSNKQAQYVISSPPYLNRHDYTRVFALEMALHFVETNQDLIFLRHSAFRSHVEAKPPTITDNSYQSPEMLKNLMTQVKTASRDRDKKRIPQMIKGYFEDIHMTLASLYEWIERGGKIAFVLGNVRFSGVMIPVDEIVAEIGERVGLSVEKIIVARYRGNSAQQMAQFGREPARESIIIWQKR